MEKYKRLTGWDRDNAYVRECFERNEAEGGCEDMDTSKCTFCEHFLAIFNRLATYEDSGLSPEDTKELVKAKAEGRMIILPVPIGASIFVPYRDKELDGSIYEGVEELHLSGYVKEGNREFYLTYGDDEGSCDIEPSKLYTSREEAEKALEIGGGQDGGTEV